MLGRFIAEGVRKEGGQGHTEPQRGVVVEGCRGESLMPSRRQKRHANNLDRALAGLEEWEDWSRAGFSGLAARALESGRQWSGEWWWSQFGGKWPVLKEIAVKLLGQRATSSACERGWSAFSSVDSDDRNQLGREKAGELTRLLYNKRNYSASQAVRSFWQTVPLEGMCDEEEC